MLGSPQLVVAPALGARKGTMIRSAVAIAIFTLLAVIQLVAALFAWFDDKPYDVVICGALFLMASWIVNQELRQTW